MFIIFNAQKTPQIMYFPFHVEQKIQLIYVHRTGKLNDCHTGLENKDGWMDLIAAV